MTSHKHSSPTIEYNEKYIAKILTIHWYDLHFEWEDYWQYTHDQTSWGLKVSLAARKKQVAPVNTIWRKIHKVSQITLTLKTISLDKNSIRNENLKNVNIYLPATILVDHKADIQVHPRWKSATKKAGIPTKLHYRMSAEF